MVNPVTLNARSLHIVRICVVLSATPTMQMYTVYLHLLATLLETTALLGHLSLVQSQSMANRL